MDPLEVEPDNLSKASSAFTDIANTARRIGNGMRDGLSTLGNFAGNDSFGRNFTPDFTSGTTGMANTCLGFGDGMDGTADGLKNSAAAYQATDANNADSIHPTSLQ